MGEALEEELGRDRLSLRLLLHSIKVELLAILVVLPFAIVGGGSRLGGAFGPAGKEGLLLFVEARLEARVGVSLDGGEEDSFRLLCVAPAQHCEVFLKQLEQA